MSRDRGVLQFLLSAIVMVAVFFVVVSVDAQDVSIKRVTAKSSAKPEAGAAKKEAEAATPAAPVKRTDYSRGFLKFYKLGLPNVKGAKYVKLQMYSSGGYSSGGMYDLQLSGDAWLIEENETGPSKFVTGDCKIVEIYDNKKLQKILKEERKAKEKEDEKAGKKKPATRVVRYYGQDEKGRIGGTWKEVDLSKDIAKTIKYLKKQQGDENKRRQFSYSDSYGTLFLRSMHYHAQGHADEANEIVGILFEMSQDRRQVILKALNRLADNGYDEVMSKFSKEADWPVLLTDLTGLLRRFTVGWKKGPAVKRLYDNVKARVAQPTPPAIAGLSAADQALAAELATLEKPSQSRQNGYGMYGGQIWVLTKPKKSKKSKKSDASEKPDVLTRLRLGGMDSVPLLIALLEDEYLTKMDNQSLSGRTYYSSSRSGAMSEEQLEQMYKSLRRPATRGEIAFKLLQPLPLAEEEHSSRWEDAGELAVACKEWYEASKTNSVMQLAKMYMASPNSQQSRAAMQYLIKYGGESETAMIEKTLLEADSSGQDTYMVQQYVSLRQEKAKDFVARYEVALTNQMETSEDEMFQNKGYKKQIARQIKQLKDIVSARPAAEVIADIIAGKTKLEDEAQALRTGLGKLKTDEILDLLLSSALKAKESKLRRSLLSTAAQARYMRSYNRYAMMDEGDEEEESPKLDIKTHEALWKQLLADKTEVEDRSWGAASGKITIAQFSASIIEGLYAEGDAGMARQSRGALGSDAMLLLEKRAAERLQGKTGDELTQFPSADNVSEEQLAAILAKLKAADGAALITLVKALTPDQQLAVAADIDEEDPLNVELSPYALVIRDVNLKTEDAATVAALNAFKGKKISKALVEMLKKTTEQIVTRGNVATVALTRRANLKGVVMSVKEIKSDSDEFKPMTRNYGRQSKKGVAVIRGGVQAGQGLYANTTWNLKVEIPEAKGDSAKKGDPKKAETKKAASDDELDAMLEEEMDSLDDASEDREVESRKKFWETTEELLKGKGHVFSSAMIYFSGIPVLPESDEDDDDVMW
jgi:hypothetical protein